MTKAITKRNPVTEFSAHLTAYSDKFKPWCPEGGNLTPSSLVNFGVKVFASETKFHHPSCWPSLRLALITAAQLGLEPSGPFGECFILPYKQGNGYIAQLQPGFRGLVKLARQSGEIKNIRSHVVHENDDFTIYQGDDPRIHHKLCTGDRGAIVGAYSIAYFVDGETDFEWAPWAEIQKAKKNTPAWKEWPGEMARKFVLKRHCKQLPVSPVAMRAIALDNAEGEGVSKVQEIIDVDVIDVAEAPPEPGEDKLAKKLKARKSKRKATPREKGIAHEEAVVDEYSQPEKELTAEDTKGVVCTQCGVPFEGVGDLCKGCQDEDGEWDKSGE